MKLRISLLATLISISISTAALTSTGFAQVFAPTLGAPSTTAPIADSPNPQPMDRVWYGWQPLLTDALAAVLLASWFHNDEGSRGEVGFVLYTLGAPAIHVANDKPATALASVALRLGVPLILGSVVYGVTRGDCIDCHSTDGLFEGLGAAAIGAVAASVIDIALLSRKSVPRPQDAPRWAPQLQVSGTRVVAGVTLRL